MAASIGHVRPRRTGLAGRPGRRARGQRRLQTAPASHLLAIAPSRCRRRRRRRALEPPPRRHRDAAVRRPLPSIRSDSSVGTAMAGRRREFDGRRPSRLTPPLGDDAARAGLAAPELDGVHLNGRHCATIELCLRARPRDGTLAAGAAADSRWRRRTRRPTRRRTSSPRPAPPPVKVARAAKSRRRAAPTARRHAAVAAILARQRFSQRLADTTVKVAPSPAASLQFGISRTTACSARQRSVRRRHLRLCRPPSSSLTVDSGASTTSRRQAPVLFQRGLDLSLTAADGTASSAASDDNTAGASSSTAGRLLPGRTAARAQGRRRRASRARAGARTSAGGGSRELRTSDDDDEAVPLEAPALTTTPTATAAPRRVGSPRRRRHRRAVGGGGHGTR